MIPAFLLKNPIASVLGVVALVAGLLLGVQTVRLAWAQQATTKCEASIALEAAKAEAKVRAFKDADSEFRRQLSESLAPVVDDLRKQSNDTQTALAKVASNPICRDTPATRAFDAGVRPNAGQQTGNGPAR